MTNPALRFQNVAKHYAGKPVLRGIDLEVAAGEIFALVGMNGAGKTSLIKCLLDFNALDGGDIAIYGVDSKLPAARRRLAFLPERFLPPYHLTGNDFLRYVLQLQKQPYDAAAVAETLQTLDLEPAALKRTIREYSKGMTQKLGLAASFLSNKQLLILDEPASGLDPKAQALLKRRLQRLREDGSTLFFTTHALTDVEELCDRLAILHDGVLQFIGTPADCRKQFGAETLEQAFLACIANR